jgi:phosphoglycolate phosphatase
MTRAFSGYAVFDLDGTLADSLGDISRALGRVLQSHGRKVISKSETRDLIGKGPRTLIERAWILTGDPAEEDEARRLTQEYLEEYRKNPRGGTRSFPGVDEGLRQLVLRGWRLGLCTNKDGRAARALVEELGWGRWIQTVVSGEEGFRKPDPRPLHLAFRQLGAPRGRHLFIGDSEVDLRTARNAGVEGVFLGHGYGEFGKMGMDGMHYFEEAVAMFQWMGRARAEGPARR